MKNASVLILSALFSFAAPTGIAKALEGWDPVKAANLMGAMDWCLSNSGISESEKGVYQVISQGADRALDHFSETGEMTKAEAMLVKDRVRDQGYYFGLQLDAAECSNLRNIAINWHPWQLVTSQDASFVVEMPNEPERDDTSGTIQGRDFDWILHETFVKPENNPLLEKEEYYFVGYTELPQDYLASQSKDEIFDAFSEHILTEMGLSELQLTSRKVSPDGVPARVISGDAYGQSAATIMYIVDNRFYVTLMVGKEQAHFERFLRSFEALDFSDTTASSSRPTSQVEAVRGLY